MAKATSNPIGPAAVAAGAFVLIAIGGRIFTFDQMHKTADAHNMSTGRTGVARSNQPSDQDAASARGPRTTGTNVAAESRNRERFAN